MLVPHGAYILAIDGGHTRLLRNRGRECAIDLDTIDERRLFNPRTHILSETQPGRAFQAIGRERSAYESTDTHRRRGDAFCEAALEDAITAAADAPALILIAPPRVMGVLRKHVMRRRPHPLVHEIVKDLTSLAPQALAEHIRDLR